MGIVNNALAQITSLTPINTANGATDVEGLAGQIVNVVLLIAGILAVVYLLYSGILYITAAGNPDAAKKGQQGVINAVIGIVIILLAYVIINAVMGSTTTLFGTRSR